MKKIICLVLIFTMMLTACSKWEVEIVDPTKPSESETEIPEIKEPEEEEESSDILIVNRVTASNAFSEMGVSQKAYNLIVYDNGTTTFDLVLKNGDKKIRKNVRGLYFEDDNYGKHFCWEGYSFCENYVSVCYNGGVFIVDLEEFSVVDIDFEFPETEGTNFWINGVIYDEETGWIVSASEAYQNHLYEDPTVWHIFVFNENGKLINRYYPKAAAPNGGWADYATPSVARKCSVIEDGGKTYYSFGYRSYCIDDGKAYKGYSIQEPYNAEANGYRVCFYSVFEIIGEENINDYNSGKHLGYYAVLKDTDENILDFLKTDDNYIEDAANREEFEKALQLTHNGGLNFTLRNIYLGKKIDLDFENGSYLFEYEYTDEVLDELMATSVGGKYSLWQVGVQAGGEAYFYEVAIKNNETGKITHVDSSGTNVGTFTSEGFLRNGDFYIFSSSGLKIYNPETVEVVFDINDNFSMENRILYTFRRDPEDFSYIVVYSDCTSEDIQKGYADDTGFMPFTIKIGYLDKDGNLIKSFDSGIYECCDFFGLEGLEMRYSKDTLTFITTGGKGLDPKEFRFDRKTETFYQ